MFAELMTKGGPVMWPLLLCSIWGLALICERTLFWVHLKRRLRPAEMDAWLEHLRHGRIKDVLRMGRSGRNPIITGLVRALEHGDRALHDTLGLAIDQAHEQTQQRLWALDTVITLAPLLGIFGTVTGIIKSFNLLGHWAQADPQAVSVGIAEALITTAAGLAIAMPALVCYNLFQTQSRRYVFRLERYAGEFESLYAQWKEREAASEVPSPWEGEGRVRVRQGEQIPAQAEANSLPSPPPSP